MENIIESITVGSGEESIFFSIKENVSESYKVDEIREDVKNIGKCNITVYCGYVNGKLRVEAEAGSGITIYYKK